MTANQNRFWPHLAPRIRRALTCATALVLALVASLVVVAPASAATWPSNPMGHLDHVSRSGHLVTLTGWAADNQHGWASIALRVTVDGHVGAIGSTGTGMPRPGIASKFHITPDSGYLVTVFVPSGRHLVRITAVSAYGLVASRIGDTWVTVAGPAPATPRVWAVAKLAPTFIGVPYVFAAASPKAFDCSGFTMYLYARVLHISLPHLAQAQFNLATRIPKSHARAGDLVFWHNKDWSVPHVAVYAGHDMVYEAGGVGGNRVTMDMLWTNSVTFGSFTHN